MTDRAPIEVTNLDGYGNPVLPWSRAHDVLANASTSGTTIFLGTVRPDGRPHSAVVFALWHDGVFYIITGPETRKSRNLEANPACTLSARLEGLDIVLEGEAKRVTDLATLELAAGLFRATGWPVTVQGDTVTAPYNAPSAGKPPYYLYRLTYHTAFGTGTAEPSGATRWRFE